MAKDNIYRGYEIKVLMSQFQSLLVAFFTSWLYTVVRIRSLKLPQMLQTTQPFMCLIMYRPSAHPACAGQSGGGWDLQSGLHATRCQPIAVQASCYDHVFARVHL